jgi:hypothetical protein
MGPRLWSAVAPIWIKHRLIGRLEHVMTLLNRIAKPGAKKLLAIDGGGIRAVL